MSENIDINVGIIKEEISINAANNIVEVNISTAPVTIINPQNYDLSQFTNTSPNPFIQQSTLSSYVPISRIITINGVAQDLSTNRSWTIPGATWGSITGTLAAQTDLQAALNAKVPTSRTLTINGVTQDLSANRTFTISTGITIGSTAIASGVVGRVLFEGAGNVVQESSSLFWDDTNVALQLGTTSTRILNFRPQDTTGTYGNSSSIRGGALNGRLDFFSASNITQLFDNTVVIRSNSGPYIFLSSYISFLLGGSTRLLIAETTGNVLINTTTDAGFRLDVNGTARVQSLQILSTGNFGNSIIRTSASGIAEQIYNSGGTTYLGADSSAGGFLFTGGLPYASFFGNGANYPTQFGTNGTTRMTIFAGGNVAINTTTDAGFRLDVNGTARVKTTDTSTPLNIAHSGSVGIQIEANANGYRMRLASTSTFSDISTPDSYLTLNQSGQRVVIGSSTIYNSAQLAVDSTTKGFLPPRMTTTQINAITSPAEGLMVYNTTISHMCVYQAGSWVKLSHSPM